MIIYSIGQIYEDVNMTVSSKNVTHIISISPMTFNCLKIL